MIICDELVGPAMGARMVAAGARPLAFLLVPGNGDVRLGTGEGNPIGRSYGGRGTVQTPRPVRRRRWKRCWACDGRGRVPVGEQATDGRGRGR